MPHLMKMVKIRSPEVPSLEMRPEPVRELLPIIPYGRDDTETEATSPSEASAKFRKENDNGNKGNNGNGGNGNHLWLGRRRIRWKQRRKRE